MGKYIFGVDVGGTSIKLGMFTVEGKLICKWPIPTNKENGGAQILPEIHREIRGKLAEYGADPEECGVGIGVPGPVYSDGRVAGCWNLGWGAFDLKGEAKAELQMQVAVCNDADAALLGEVWKGSAKGCQNVFMLTLGTGIGGSVLCNGQNVYGAHGCGGELAHMQVNLEEEETCVCGRKGCINQYGALSGFMHTAELVADRQEPAKRAVLKKQLQTPKDIWELAAQGDAAGMEIMDLYADTVARALASAACIIDPELFLIGGGLCAAGELLLERVRASYQKQVYTPCKETPILQASLGNDAGIWGTAYLIRQKMEN